MTSSDDRGLDLGCASATISTAAHYTLIALADFIRLSASAGSAEGALRKSWTLREF
jgi:hypothetical protein